MKMITADKLSNAEYHAKTEYISSSAVKEVHGKSLAHWQARKSFKSTPAMAIGTAVHDIVLEGGNGIVRHNGPDRRGKQWSEPFAEAEANDKLLMTAADYDLAIAVAGSVLDHPVGRKMEGKDTINEASFFAKDPQSGLDIKCRPDSYDPNTGAIFDIKTCQDSSPSAVQADIRKYSYPIQAAFYLHTLRCAGFKAERFIFVFVEKTTPYAVNVTELTLGYIAWADSAMHKALSDIKQARETNVYDTGFSTGINMVDIPHWLNQEIANNDDF
jgi:exodeoxyribonuclease VIII